MEEIEQRMEFEHMAGGGKRTLLATKKGWQAGLGGRWQHRFLPPDGQWAEKEENHPKLGTWGGLLTN
jgi:hypothetical protein